MIRKTLNALVVVCVFALLPAQVRATFHLMKVVEVFPGTATDPTAQYIMLQMYFPGQNFVAGHSVAVFDTNGMTLGTFTFPSDLANGADLATILIATPDAQTLFGVTADLMMTPVIPAAGGAVCYDVIDCVAWGSFSAPNTLPVPPGTPFNAPTGLVLGMAMHRDLSSGGSVTNFVLAPPEPRNNAGQTGMLGATPTPGATATPTPAATVTPPPCVGDCNDSGQVTVDEILTMVNIALSNTSISACEAGDENHDSQITVDEILTAVNHALNGCSGAEQACVGSGGTVSTSLCCAGVGDFPNTCSIGACGCSPQASHEVQICNCGAGKCFGEASAGCVTR
jgi:hypothetical protein